MAKVEHIELTAEEAEKALAGLHKTGELSDEELDNVSGGCGDEIQWDNKNLMAPRGCDVKFAFEIGTRVVRYDISIIKVRSLTERLTFCGPTIGVGII